MTPQAVVDHDDTTIIGQLATNIQSGGHVVAAQSDARPVDLNSCDREAIHIPGSIQPHGLMLVAGCHDFRVHHVAGDVEERLGVIWKDQPLSALITTTLAGKIDALLSPGAVGGLIGQLQGRTNELLDVSAHRSGADLIVELETASSVVRPTSTALDGLAEAAAGFELSVNLIALCDRAAFEFRHLTGFDRVMIYRLLDDGAGRVVAESRREDLHSFLNQHFPASDIPRQARALYIRNLIRVIPDVSYQPARLRPDWIEPAPLDMADSSLRSVSPVHLQYLVNMDVKASASVSIVKDGVLWGLIACHHLSPRSLSYEIRAACRSMAGSLSRQIKSKKRRRLIAKEFASVTLKMTSSRCFPGRPRSKRLSPIISTRYAE